MARSAVFSRARLTLISTQGCTVLPVKSQLMSDGQSPGTPVATSAVEHDVVVVLPGRGGVELPLEQVRRQFQPLLQDAHSKKDTGKRRQADPSQTASK